MKALYLCAIQRQQDREFRDGNIRREKLWMDLRSVAAQPTGAAS